MNGIDNVTFGVTMVVVGMGGTLLTLWVLTILIDVIKKIFPVAKSSIK